MSQPSSFLWHDYETTGVDPRRDRPTQFAAIRTDADLNEIGTPLDLLCVLPDDVLPSPTAAVLTGLSPRKCQAEGLNEADFCARIHAEMMRPGTCAVGYNTLRFDDEVSRNMFYRNLRDPYEREWSNGNSRWDIIDMVRTCHAFRPEGIAWPVGEDGAVSFKLEDIARANGLVVDHAHDALSDVRTTIAVAKLVKSAQPKLFEHMLGMRDKKPMLELLQDPRRRVLAHVATAYGKEHRCVGLVVPIGPHPTNKNGVVVVDLSVDPDGWIDLDAEEIAARIAWKPFEPGQDREKVFMRVIQANKCPALFSSSIVKDAPEHFPFLDLEQVGKNYARICADETLLARIQVAIAINEEKREQTQDPELAIYNGFLGGKDKGLLREILSLPPGQLAGRHFSFADQRLDPLVFRYRARNFPETLGPEEMEDWHAFCARRLTHRSELGPRTIEEFRSELTDLVARKVLEPDSQMHRDLSDWADQKEAWLADLPVSSPRPSRSIGV